MLTCFLDQYLHPSELESDIMSIFNRESWMALLDIARYIWICSMASLDIVRAIM
jgi:hypothetical protein